MSELHGRGQVKVLHVLAKSRPELNGYSIRGHEIMKAQIDSGRALPIAITSPYYPELDSMKEHAVIDGIRYNRCPPINLSNKGGLRMGFLRFRVRKKLQNRRVGNTKKSDIAKGDKGLASTIWGSVSGLSRMFLSFIEERLQMEYFQQYSDKVLAEMEPDFVHAHTPYRVGIPALRSAGKFGIPFIYEVRGLWEDSAVARGNFRNNGFRYRRFRRLETKVMKSADAIICISEGVAGELVNRGVQEHRITVVGNGAPLEYISGSALEPSINSLTEAAYSKFEEINDVRGDSRVIGYIGSTQRYEGLEILADAVKIVNSKGSGVRLLIVGSTDYQEELSDYCKKIGISDVTTICGPFDRSEILSFYSLIDIFVVPRLPFSKMARLVTPLKPLESMALGIPTIVSDTPAMREIVGDGVGIFFGGGKSEELAEKISLLLENPDLCKRMTEKGQAWVRENATWDIAAGKISQVYTSIAKD